MDAGLPRPWLRASVLLALAVAILPLASVPALGQAPPTAAPADPTPCEPQEPQPWRPHQPGASPIGPSSVTYLDEMEMGRAWSADLERKYGTAGDERLERIGRSVARYADRSQLRFYFLVLNNPGEINAFSLPGGHVYLTRGLMDALLLSDDELAFVLGHEIAHAAFRDIANGIIDQGIARYVNRVFCQRLANLTSPDLLRIPLETLNEHVNAAIQRRELNADQFGVLYALRAGYHAGGAVTFLEKVVQKLGDTTLLGSHPGALPPHPTVPARLEEIRKGVDQLAYAANKFEVGYRSLVEGDFDRAIAIFEALVAVFPQSQNALVNLGAAYHGRFRVAARREEPASVILFAGNLEARWKSLLGPRRALGPDRSYLLAAQEKYRMALALDPENQIARNDLAVSLLDDRNLDEAITHLEAAAAIRQVEPATYKNLAIAYCEKLKALRQEPATARTADAASGVEGTRGKAGAALSAYKALRPDDEEVPIIQARLLAYAREPS